MADRASRNVVIGRYPQAVCRRVEGGMFAVFLVEGSAPYVKSHSASLSWRLTKLKLAAKDKLK